MRATILVRGRVQGVGYRAFVRRHALDLGLAGHAENLADGRVEVLLEGERREIEHALVALSRGPAHATVAALEVAWSEAAGLRGFHVL
ncbi:MAG: acylphosphatase [Trueperaceae bacterium]|nr:acylphosphatase [Trueperaceae bacterium]